MLFADNTALVVDQSEKLQMMMFEFGKVCERRVYLMRFVVEESNLCVSLSGGNLVKLG